MPILYRYSAHPVNTSPREGLRITRPGGGHILPPAISAPRNARNTKLDCNDCFVCLFVCFLLGLKLFRPVLTITGLWDGQTEGDSCLS